MIRILLLRFNTICKVLHYEYCWADGFDLYLMVYCATKIKVYLHSNYCLMEFFRTNRLLVRSLREADADDYFDMMGNPNVMNPIPREIMSRKESDDHLEKFLAENQELNGIKAWAIELVDRTEFIGLCAFLKNDENQDEIGYRLREKHWRQGYGTEVTKGLLCYGFEHLKLNIITADVAISNAIFSQDFRKIHDRKKGILQPS